MIDFTRVRKSFYAASRGLSIAFKEEQNFRTHVYMTFLVLIAALIFQLHPFEWIALILSISIVLGFELFNSMSERLLDSVKPRISPLTGTMKDLMSAAVLITAISTFCVGLFIFGPRIIHLVSSLLNNYTVY